MRNYYFVTINCDGHEYFYDIYIRGSEAAKREAKKQLYNRYGYTDSDITNVRVSKH